MSFFPRIDNNDMGLTTVPNIVPTLFDDQPTVNNINLDEQANKLAKTSRFIFDFYIVLQAKNCNSSKIANKFIAKIYIFCLKPFK